MSGARARWIGIDRPAGAANGARVDMKNVILGRCLQQRDDQVEPFLRSCRRHYQDRIVLFVSNCDTTIGELGRRYNAELIHVEARNHAVNDRFFFYQDFLRANEGVRNCFLTDIRDVVFQANPFSGLLREEIIKFYEEEGCFSATEVNHRWYAAIYGEEAATGLNGKPIICAGTTLAGGKGAIDYVSRMAAEIERTGVTKFGADQAIHNHLFYSGALPNAVSTRNRVSEVQTMGLQTRFTLDVQGRLLNDDGSVPAVVHQYDRHEFLVRHFDGNPEMVRLAMTDKRRLRRLDRSRSAAFAHFLKVAIQKAAH